MNKILTLLLVFATAVAMAQSPSPELIKIISFEGMQNKVKKGYGSLADPIPSGAFKNVNDDNNRRSKMLKLMNSYRWPDGTLLDFSKRFSTKAQDGKGIVDCYTLINPGTADTIKLFVDPYRDTTVYFVPEGLVAVTPTQLAKEIAPYVKQIEEMEAAPDASILKESSSQTLVYLGQKIGFSGFVDNDILAGVVAEKEADKELTGFLVRAYIFNKFYAYAKNLPDSKAYAFEKMKANFREFTAAHPEVNTGNLKITLK